MILIFCYFKLKMFYFYSSWLLETFYDSNNTDRLKDLKKNIIKSNSWLCLFKLRILFNMLSTSCKSLYPGWSTIFCQLHLHLARKNGHNSRSSAAVLAALLHESRNNDESLPWWIVISQLWCRIRSAAARVITHSESPEITADLLHPACAVWPPVVTAPTLSYTPWPTK